ncbi:hypothetical protein BHE74_00003769 [Ensete ventricosum]|nr:hypothetical protein BHE74_00003769 [Ensete ventricosum]
MGEKESPADDSSPANDESHECSVSQREEKESPAGDSSLASDKSRRRRMAQITECFKSRIAIPIHTGIPSLARYGTIPGTE